MPADPFSDGRPSARDRISACTGMPRLAQPGRTAPMCGRADRASILGSGATAPRESRDAGSES